MTVWPQLLVNPILGFELVGTLTVMPAMRQRVIVAGSTMDVELNVPPDPVTCVGADGAPPPHPGAVMMKPLRTTAITVLNPSRISPLPGLLDRTDRSDSR